MGLTSGKPLYWLGIAADCYLFGKSAWHMLHCRGVFCHKSGSVLRKRQADMRCFFVGRWCPITGLVWRLLVVLLVIQGALPGLVMCFGSNGHVAVEPPHRRCPHPTSQSQAPCLDLPFISVSSDARPLVVVRSSTLPELVPVPATLSGSLPLLAPAVFADVLLSPIPTGTPLIAALRTVVLLI